MAEPAAALAVPSVQATRSGKNWGYHARRVPLVVWVCAAVLLFMAAAAVFAPVLAPASPTDQSLMLRLKPPVWM